ncbi:MAG TPA: cytochrome c oxidase subunit II [Bryobacteraceae bacterium]|jgi:cytochrome c oxidase subunit 2|nr:cytochrome c oxidase subunit II [Bryobacteraceae bacterium]
MITNFHLFPESASSVAGEVNLFFICMVTLCTVVAVGIAVVLIYSAIRYHRKSENELGSQARYNIPVEATWTIIPFILFVGMFGWGAKMYFDIERPPDNAINIYVVGKQWMWKVQHPEGQREIDELHIPVGRPVKLTMTSEDAIHSFFVPAFRTKQDVLPGRYTTTWFEATKPGKYHLFCSQYCGTNHSRMIGWVYAMTPADYQNWLTQGAAEGSLASTGEKYFHQFGCANCHHFGSQGRCPDLRNLYMRPVLLNNGQTIVADDSYIREKLRDPNAQVPWGFSTNVMPNFTGVVSEEQILALISYIKALGPQPGTQEPSNSGTAPTEYGSQKGIAGPGATSGSGAQLERR